MLGKPLFDRDRSLPADGFFDPGRVSAGPVDIACNGTSIIDPERPRR
jgi:hypothetical protein